MQEQEGSTVRCGGSTTDVENKWRKEETVEEGDMWTKEVQKEEKKNGE